MTDRTVGAVPATRWEDAWATFDRWNAAGLLAVSAVVAALAPEGSASRGGTLVLVAVAATWIAFGQGSWGATQRARPLPGLVYVAGLIVLAGLLMARDRQFFIFAVAGFLATAPLRPLPLVFVGTGSTSFLILYFTWGGVPTATDEAIAFGAVLAIQTVVIGFGVTSGEKLTQLNEERRRNVADLRRTLAENEALHAQLLQRAREAGIAEERQRLAREIHDTLAQGLTGVITQLEAAEQSDDDTTIRRHHLDNAAALARDSLTEARRSVQALSPTALEHGRLADAIGKLVDDWSQLHGIRAAAVQPDDPPALPTGVEVALLRVTQEALANVAKHADASRVAVTVSVLDDRVVLDVRDDGRGFEPSSVATDGSFGLTGMRQRVAALGGSLDVESSPGDGTAICASVPISVVETADV